MNTSTTAAVLNAIPFPVGIGYVYLGLWSWAGVSVLMRIGAFLFGTLLTWGVASAFGPYGLGDWSPVGVRFAAIVLTMVAQWTPFAAMLAWEARRASRLARAPSSPSRRLVRRLTFGLLALLVLVTVAVLIALALAPLSGGGL